MTAITESIMSATKNAIAALLLALAAPAYAQVVPPMPAFEGPITEGGDM